MEVSGSWNNTDMKIALDLDGTLAQTYEVAFDLLDSDVSYEDMESWGWGLREFGEAAFLSAIWHSWTLRPHDIEPIESNVSRKTSALWTRSEQLDIVTADPGHLGIKDAKRAWLDDQNISYDDLRISPMGGSKTQFDYDVYIDDNPHLPLEVTERPVLLYDAPYNQDASGNYTRVTSLGEAIKILGGLTA